ncbi:MAG: VTC domain-containing protein [Dehalococcoidia bacterium]
MNGTHSSTHSRPAGSPWGSGQLAALADRFDAISLTDAAGAALQDRRDRKYVVAAAALPELLAGLESSYRALEVCGERAQRYRTLYFDTTELGSYFDHHRDKPARFKVRRREYVSSGVAFLEVKRRTPAGRTVKSRIASCWQPALPADEAEWLRDDRQLSGSFSPQLANRFTRLTLVSSARPERVTVDAAISFLRCGERVDLVGAAIVEVKDEGSGSESRVAARLRAAAQRPAGFSKYCTGLALLEPQLKRNAFKAHLRRLPHFAGSDSHV